MNKGLAAATGDYVWFMNAGDLIYSPQTTEKIFASGQLASIYYGEAMIVDSAYREVGLRRLRPPEKLTWKSFKKGMLVCHQAILVRRDITVPFDPQYRHSADYDWVLKALKKAEGRGQRAEIRKKNKEEGINGGTELMVYPGLQSGGSVVHTHLILCSFLDGGHSKQNIGISLRERFHSMVRHYGLLPTVLRHIPIAIRFGWYYLRNKRF